MVHISEFRIVLPLSVEEYRRGQRYANWKTNEANTREGQGGQLLSSTPYVHEQWGPGFYQHSLYRLGDRLPEWVTRLVPKNALVIDEKSWICYPWSRSIMTIPFFNKFSIEVLSMHEENLGTNENVHGLSPEELQIRKVDYIDIAMDKVPKQDYKLELDPCQYVSRKTGRGPLTKGWQETAKPAMCAYKLVKAEANYWGVQTRVEKLTVNGIRQVFLLTHRNAVCLMDEWFDIPYDKVLAMEIAGRKKLALQKQPPVIDPNTGKTLAIKADADEASQAVVANGNAGCGKAGGRAEQTSETSSPLAEEDEESDIDQEFFEAEMELASQEGEGMLTMCVADPSGNGPRSPFVTLPGSLNNTSALSVPLLNSCSMCEVCESLGRTQQMAELLCETCNEVYCGPCFHQIHVTQRLKAHRRHQLSAMSPDPPAPTAALVKPNLAGSDIRAFTNNPSTLAIEGGLPGEKLVAATAGLNRTSSFAFEQDEKVAEMQMSPFELNARSRSVSVSGLYRPAPSVKVTDAVSQLAEFERPRHSAQGWLNKGRTVVLNPLPFEADVGCLPSSSKVEALPNSPTVETSLGKLAVDSWQPGFPNQPNELAEEMVRTMASIYTRQAQLGLRPPHQHSSEDRHATVNSVSSSLSRTPSSLSSASTSAHIHTTLPPLPTLRSESTHSLLSNNTHIAQQPHTHPFAHNDDPELLQHSSAHKLIENNVEDHSSTLPFTTNHSSNNNHSRGFRNSSFSPRRSPSPTLSVPIPNGNTTSSARYSRNSSGLFEEVGANSPRNSSPSSHALGSSPRSFSSFRRGGGSPRLSSGSAAVPDPYGGHEEDSFWSGASGVYATTGEVGWVSGDRDVLAGDAELIAKYRSLVDQLRDTELTGLAHEHRLAFWINVYNALVMHAYLTFGIPRSYLKRMSLMHKSAYVIGGMCFSALSIEHVMLRAHSHRPALTGILPVQRYRPGDPRLLWALDRPEPLVTFALCAGTRSSPVLHVYTGKGIQEQLQSATREFCRVAVGFTKSNRVLVPKLIHWYAKDFSTDAKTLLEWIATHLPEAQQLAIQQRLARAHGHGSRAMTVAAYDWTFRYLIPPESQIIVPAAPFQGLLPALAEKNGLIVL